MISLSKSPSVAGGTAPPSMVPFTILPPKSSLNIGSPMTSVTINNGIVTWAPTAPGAIITGSPGTLFTIMTATAPSFCAAKALKPNSHSPRRITTILPSSDGPLVIGSQASCGSVEVPPELSSSTATRSSVSGGIGIGPPKFAGTPGYTPASGPLLIVNKLIGPELVVQINICIRGFPPSGGVAKFALLVPEPSWASAFTESEPLPGLP